ncbi:cysteine dioxygenase [Xylaria digitata]|nr:cysteine dioxygenase [Xylaria digitata]
MIMEAPPAINPFSIKHMDTSPDENQFDKLVTSLTEALGPSSGLTSDDVDVTSLMRLMKLYESRECGWVKYAFGDSDTDYTRNLVDEGNGKSNLLVLVWSPGKGSPIHDHGNAHCLMKILKGDLTETRYAFPQQGHSHPLDIISEKTYGENEVAYIADELGVHRMFNKGSEFAVSLHLYTPPHVAKKGCCIFDERTGTRNRVPGPSYHSAYGRLLEEPK